MQREPFDLENEPPYDHPEIKAMSRLNMQQALTFDPEKGVNQVGDGTLHTWSSITHTPIQPNTRIWKQGSRTLDFACGAGNNSIEIAPFVGEIVGLDNDPDKVAAYNDRVSETKGVALQGVDLLADNPDLAQIGRFDQAVCALAYHHIKEYHLLTKRLASVLKQDGWLLVIDFEGVDDDGPVTQEDVVYPEMCANDIRQSMIDAGLRNVSVVSSVDMEFWAPEPYIPYLCRNVNKSTSQKRVASDGTIEFRKVIRFATIAGQK